jgi:putative ABC transport system permease protein
VNLALRDVRYRLGRFVLTALGLSLLLTTVMAMSGIYRGLVDDAVSLLRALDADLWVVQKDTNGPFAETSRIPDDLARAVRTVPGVGEAGAVAFQVVQVRHGGRATRVQLVGHRPGGLGGPPAVVRGRPLLRGRYEMVVDRRLGVPPGTRLALGRLTLTVVGLTEGVVSSSGDPVAFVSLEDAQEVQFLKSSEAIRNDRSRLAAALRAAPDLADVAPEALGPVVESTRLANAVLVRLRAGADAREVAAHVERWNHYRAMTADDQQDVLTRSVIERARQQLLLFRIILVVVVAVIIALIVYTLTLEKTRDIATLKVIGAPDAAIGGLIVQESLALGLSAYALAAGLIALTADLFPRRVVVTGFDQQVLLAIVVVIGLLASLLGVRRALAVDPTTALAGG